MSSQNILLFLDYEFNKELDEYCKREFRNKTSVLRKALRDFLDKEEKKEEII